MPGFHSFLGMLNQAQKRKHKIRRALFLLVDCAILLETKRCEKLSDWSAWEIKFFCTTLRR